MELLELNGALQTNLLPKDGVVYYYSSFLKENTSEEYFNSFLKKIDWKKDELIIFGKKIITKRMVAWYGDYPFHYSYSHTIKEALPWTTDLKNLKNIIEKETGESFNSCLLNLYHNGSEGMGWHSDNETELKKMGTIASISLGADRKFRFMHKHTKEKIEVELGHGSLLLMSGKTQEFWLHQLPVSKRITESRINLTFRTIVQNQ
ncbi:MAG: alpha-ketoglutarate-dependent dioxygenase AlkB family protein [Bacteroidota bacterium]